VTSRPSVSPGQTAGSAQRGTAAADTLVKNREAEVDEVSSTRRPNQAGFIREILWVSLAVLVAAVVVLDAVSLYSAYERVQRDTEDAARQARQTYVQALDVGVAESAARKLLEQRGDGYVGVETERVDDTLVFVVSAERHVDTYAFRYLGHVPGLEEWVAQTMNPVATGRSD
jgi:hypothetical protein